MGDLKFALNHMVAAGHSVDEFLELAIALGINAIELRNDLGEGAIAGGKSPETLRRELAERGIELISINALQRFTDWNDKREEEASALIDYAASAGAQALVLVPANDGTSIPLESLITSLNALGPILLQAGIVGLVEPLGFEQCTLRSKTVAIDAIQQSRFPGAFKIVHDTFHHYLAGEPQVFAKQTGLVHLSGVTEQTLAIGELRDLHRVLVNDHDQLQNIEQIQELRASGYEGFFSFEPFSEEVYNSSDLLAKLKATIAYIEARI